MSAPDRAPPFVRHLVLWVSAFGVSLLAGIAPFSKPLLGLYPENLRPALSVFSGIFTGALAAVLQFQALRRTERTVLTSWLRKAFWLLMSSMLALVLLTTFLIEPVAVGGGQTVPLIVGFVRLHGCPCTSPSNHECVQESFNPAFADACWGSAQIKISQLLLTLTYVAVTGGFVAVIGLVLLRHKGRRPPRRPRSTKTGQPGIPVGRGRRRTLALGGGASRPRASRGRLEASRSRRCRSHRSPIAGGHGGSVSHPCRRSSSAPLPAPGRCADPLPRAAGAAHQRSARR
jgi:hypothetical protein